MTSDRREFLELAHEFEPKKHSIGGWLLSLKLDGHRAFWDGSVTRGMDPMDVPWANTHKDGRYLERPKSTGLWSRGGKTIQAPNWWLDALPIGIPLDGELWMGRGLFQATSSVVKQLYPDHEAWKAIRYMVFDSPSYYAFAREGRINTPNFQKTIKSDTWKFIKEKYFSLKKEDLLPAAWSYDIALAQVALTYSAASPVWTILPQERLPASRKEAIEFIEKRLEQCEVDGDEGLIIRHPNMPWEPKRTNNLLKVKKRHTGEAEIIGYVWGKKTDKGSKLLGLMGAIVVRTLESEKIKPGLQFELSGFTDAERRLLPHKPGFDPDEGQLIPGKQVSSDWNNPKFPVGSTITFSYRELTDDGIPKEAQYDRVFKGE